MTGRNWRKVVKDNLVVITIIPMLAGIHYGWWKMQQNPNFVEVNRKQEIPFYNVFAKVFGEDTKENKASSSDKN